MCIPYPIHPLAVGSETKQKSPLPQDQNTTVSTGKNNAGESTGSWDDLEDLGGTNPITNMELNNGVFSVSANKIKSLLNKISS